MGIDGSGYQDLYDFTGGTEGAFPYGDLTLSGGTLFGMTYSGGANDYNGTIFALALPVPEPGPLALLAVGAFGLWATVCGDDGRREELQSRHPSTSTMPQPSCPSRRIRPRQARHEGQLDRTSSDMADTHLSVHLGQWAWSLAEG